MPRMPKSALSLSLDSLTTTEAIQMHAPATSEDQGPISLQVDGSQICKLVLDVVAPDFD